jgi:hypothetical protein
MACQASGIEGEHLAQRPRSSRRPLIINRCLLTTTKFLASSRLQVFRGYVGFSKLMVWCADFGAADHRRPPREHEMASPTDRVGAFGLLGKMS